MSDAEGRHKGFMGRLPRKRPAVLPLLAVFALIAVITFLYSPAFNVREVTVDGNFYLSDADVAELAAIPRDRNMLLLPATGIVSRLLMMPRIESASVSKKYPSKIEITIVERKTVAFLPYGGFFVDLDSRGAAVGVSEAVTDPNVPIITGVEASFVLLGLPVEPSDKVGFACSVGKMLALRKVPNISEVNVKDMHDVVIITNEGSRLMLGAADGIEARLDIAVEILAGARSKKQAFKYIDVRIADRPVLGTK